MLVVRARFALVALLALAPAGARAQAPIRLPRWTAPLAHAPEWVSATDRGALIVARGRVELRALADGALLGELAIPGEGAIYPAGRGERLGVWDPIQALGPSGLVGTSRGGTGRARVDLVFALDPRAPALRWTFDGASPAPGVTLRDGALIAHVEADPFEVLALDPASGEIRWRVRLRDAPRNDASVLVDGGRAYLVSYDGVVAALELSEGRLLFARRIGAADPHRSAIHDARALGGRVVLVDDRSVWALDGESGREVWRRAAHAPRIEAAGADAIVLVEHLGAVSVLSVADGATRATHAISGAHLVERAGEHLLVQGAELLVLDADGARELARFPLERHGAVTAAGSWIATIAARGDERARLVGLDVATGRRWRAAVDVADGSPVLIAGDVVAACTETGVVRGFDLATGAPRFRVSIGRHEQGGAPSCRLFPGDATTFFAEGAGGRVHALDVAPPVRRAPVVRVRVRVVGPGRVEGVRVRLGDVWRTTDAAGEIEARVRAWPALTVRADPRALPRCTSAPAVHVDTTRSRRARVTLRFAVDHCLCHDCD